MKSKTKKDINKNISNVSSKNQYCFVVMYNNLIGHFLTNLNFIYFQADKDDGMKMNNKELY